MVYKYTISNLNSQKYGQDLGSIFKQAQTQDSGQRKNIEPQSHVVQYQILILKKYGQDLGSIFKQAQTQDSRQRNNIEPRSHGIQSQILILKT